MNEEQKAIAEEIFYMFDQEHIAPVEALNASFALLQELIDAPEPEQPNQSEQHLEMVKRELFQAQQALLNEAQQRDALLAALENIIAITNDSQGVAGYHLNGDIADWDSFQEIAEAEAAIAEAKGESK